MFVGLYRLRALDAKGSNGFDIWGSWHSGSGSGGAIRMGFRDPLNYNSDMEPPK